jgi:hypothetical protein
VRLWLFTNQWELSHAFAIASPPCDHRSRVAGACLAGRRRAALASAHPKPRAPEPTAIGKLWTERQAVSREMKALEKTIARLNRQLVRLMPLPHPSIVYGPENDADGLKFYDAPREPHTMLHYIYSLDIKYAITEIGRPRCVAEKNGVELMICVDRTKPMTEKEIATRDRRKARLELSQRYEREMRRVKSTIGLTAANKKWEWLASLQTKLHNRILAMPAALREDFAIKLAIYQDEEESEYASKRIMRDVRRLVDLPRAFADAWGFDPNEATAKMVRS